MTTFQKQKKHTKKPTTTKTKTKKHFFFMARIVSIWIIYTKTILRSISWVWLTFLSRFLIMMSNYVIFDLLSFLFDPDRNAQFSVLTYLRLAQFSYTEIGSFSWRFYIMFFSIRYEVCIHRDGQHSWGFYVAERVTSFLHRDR